MDKIMKCTDFIIKFRYWALVLFFAMTILANTNTITGHILAGITVPSSESDVVTTIDGIFNVINVYTYWPRVVCGIWFFVGLGLTYYQTKQNSR